MTTEPQSASDPWSRARSFADLTRLGARFAAGELRAFPGWGFEDLDEESEDIRSALVDLNRAGLFTVASQPGASFEDDAGRQVRQRAFVIGFAAPSAAERLVAACRETQGLDVRTFDATPEDGPAAAEPVPVATCDDVPYLFVGEDAREEELALFADELEAAALRALAAATFVAAIDLEFGREELLWRALLGALSECDNGANPEASGP